MDTGQDKHEVCALLSDHRDAISLLVRFVLAQSSLPGSYEQDVVQDASLVAWRAAGRFSGETSEEFLRWVRAIVRNVVRNLKRRRQREERRRVRYDRHCEGPCQFDTPDPRSDLAEKRLLQEELREILARMAEGVPPRARRIVHDVFYRGRTSSQLAADLGISVEAARKSVQRSVARLAREVRQHYREVDLL